MERLRVGFAVPEKRPDKELQSSAWRTLVATLIQSRGKRCEQCGRTPDRIFADHIVERQDGGALLDPANVQLLCGSCHTLKSNAQRAKRQAIRY